MLRGVHCVATGLWHSADEDVTKCYIRGEEGSAATASSPVIKLNIKPRACGAAVAQGTHNPLVVGSNPSGPSF